MEEEMSSDMKQGSTFTHAPSQDVPADDMEVCVHFIAVQTFPNAET